MDISVLVRLLRENNVLHFEGYGIKLDLAPPSASGSALDAGAAAASPPMPAAPAPSPAVASKQPELPPDLRPDTMDVDKILNWSAPADPSEPAGESLPLTGDAAITE